MDSAPDQSLWVGLTDRTTEDEWRFAGENYEGEEADKDELMYKWKEGQPDNYENKEHCAHILGGSSLNDMECDYSYYGLCEIRTG